MKTHLPHGLRVALMAAIASVSLTTAYGAADEYGLKGWQTPTVKETPVSVPSGKDTYNIVDFSKKVDLNLTFKPDTSGFNRAQAQKLAMVENWDSTNYYGNVYLTAENAPFGTWLVGLSQRKTLNGDLYMRSVNSGTSITCSGTTLAVDQDSTVTGNLYLGVAGPTTYSRGVYLVKGATVKGTANLEIADGTYNGTVAAGLRNGSNSVKFENGTELNITKGTFTGNIIAGCDSSGTGTSVINGGTRLNIEGGEFSSTVYGGSTGSNSTINGSAIYNAINVSISGGTFNDGSSVYALGSGGTVNGGVNLTIENNAKFLGNNIISAGTDDSVDYSGVTSSTVFLEKLTSTSSLAKDSSIKVMGGQQQSKLVMWGGRTTIKAQLSQFSTMSLWYGADITFTQDTNEDLGGVSSVEFTLYSTSLNLQNDDGQTWDLSRVALTDVGTLKKAGAGKLTIGDTSAFAGTLNVQNGELSLSGATAAKYLTVASGATLSAKVGNLFAGTGAGSTISVNGATLAANEGDWTLNKKATIDGVTITGTHAVALGSEEDNAAVVSLSGNIDATKGNLILKNTAIAAGKTATLSGNITFEGLDNKGNLILKDTAIAADTTATLSGNITFEGLVDNKGTLSLVDGSTINIDEKTLAHDAHFVENGNVTDNGFLADTSVRLATGGEYNVGSVNVTLDGETVADMSLTTTKTEGGTNELQVSGFAEKEAKTYFVNKGEVSHSHIQAVAGDMGRTVEKISVEGTLTSDKTETISEALIGSGTLAKSGAGELTVEDSTLFTGAIKASEGTLTLLNSENASVSGLNIQGGATVGVYKNDTATAGEGDSNVGTLTLSSGALVIGADGGTLEADLVINGGTITFAQGSTLTMGCSVTIGTSDNTVTIVLDADEVAVLQGGGTLDIFTDVEGVTLNNANINFIDTNGTSYSDFSLESVEESSGKHTIRATATPEPATATLSLLALAGLCARRRRH